MNFAKLNDLTWRDVVVILGFMAAIILSRKYAAESAGDVITVVMLFITRLWQTPNSPPNSSPGVAQAGSKPDLKVISGGLMVLAWLGSVTVAACAGQPITVGDGVGIVDDLGVRVRCESVAKTALAACNGSDAGDAGVNACPAQAWAIYQSCLATANSDAGK